VRFVEGEVGRYAPTIEEAVYFCVREAIQNATKHAGEGAHIRGTVQNRAAPTAQA
jgi:signal transduction histidine kinase